MYRGKRFRIKSHDEIVAAIDDAARRFPHRRRVFLCDGDALIMPQPRLVALLREVRQRHPGVRRVASYANAKALSRKTDGELAELRSAGLKMLHMGLESGDDATLTEVGKHGDSDFIVQQGQRARAAGLQVFVTVLVGIAGVGGSLRHARATGEALTRMSPNYVGALTLMLVPGTPLHASWEAGQFRLPDSTGMLLEVRTMLQHTKLRRGIFFANHASNYVPIQCVLPDDKAETLRLLDLAIAGMVPRRPESLRGL